MYHQWSPYAGARPSTSSQASCWMSVTPENAIVGTAADTASTSRGCWAMWFIRAVAPEFRTSRTRRLTTSTRLRSRSSARSRAERCAASSDATTSTPAPASWPSIASAAWPTAKSGSSVTASRSFSSAPDCSRIRRSRPALYAAAASAVVDNGSPSGSRGRATGWWPPTSRPSASRRGSGAISSSTAVATWAACVRISGIAVDSKSSPRRTEPRVQIGASVESTESTSRPPLVRKPRPAVLSRASETPARGVSRSSTRGSIPVRTTVLVPVQLTTQPTSRRVPSVKVTASPPPVNGSASATSPAASVSVPVSRSAATTSAEPGGIRWRTRPHALASVRRNSVRSSSSSRCQSAWTTVRSPSTAGRQSPVDRWTRAMCSLTCRRYSSRVEPQSSISGIAASCSWSACRFGSSPWRETAWTRRSGRCDGPVSDSTTSTMVSPVPTSRTSAGPTASRRTTSMAPGAQGSGTKNGERCSDSGAQPTPGGFSPVARTTASPTTTRPSSAVTTTPEPSRRMPVARTRRCRSETCSSCA